MIARKWSMVLLIFFCRLFDLRDSLRKMRAEIDEKEYTTKYTSLCGNHIFNATVYSKYSFFEKFFAPVVEELNNGDRRRARDIW